MLTRTRKLIASLSLAGLVIGGTTAVAVHDATPAQAVSTCNNSGFSVAQATMCNESWKLANMTPMTPKGIVNAGYEYCGIKRAKQSSVVARDAMKWHYGNSKGGALSTAAEAWLC